MALGGLINPEFTETSDLLRDVRRYPSVFFPLNFPKLLATLQTPEHDLAHLCTIKASITKCPPSEQDSMTEDKATSQLLGEIVFFGFVHSFPQASVCQCVIYQPPHIVFFCGFLKPSSSARGFGLIIYGRENMLLSVSFLYQIM